MNKKNSLLIPAGLLFFIMLIFTSSSYGDSKILFVIRQVMVFSIFVFFIVYAQILIKDYMLKKYNLSEKREKTLKATIGISGVLLLFLVSTLQITIIKVYELPLLAACDYYDHHYNLVYASNSNSCPEILNYIESNSGNFVEIEFYESSFDDSYEGEIEYYTLLQLEYSDDIMTYYNKTSLEITYDKNDNIEIVELNKVVQNIELMPKQVLVSQDIFHILSNDITPSNYKSYEVLEYDYRNTYISKIGDWDLAYRPNYDLDITLKQTSNLDSSSTTITLGKGYVNSGDASYRVYINDEATAVSFSFRDIYITAEQDEFNYLYPEVFGSMRYSRSSQEPMLLNIIEYVNQIEDKETNIYPRYYFNEVPFKEMTYVGRAFEYTIIKDEKLIFKEMKYSLVRENGKYIIDENLYNRDFLYEVDHTRMVTDLSDTHCYLYRRNNPLIDYVLLIREGMNIYE